MQELISPKRGNMDNIGCAHVYIHTSTDPRSTIYYIPSLMNPPVQERSFFSGDGDEEHSFKK
jgi:hypothetical protein